ncbi:hypothetical protein [Chryseobacterium fistulae]|uniref:Uncharacterized protein n=1 Tax=Chryseobacterium fistulae TaxID=2675058 RepID=A0A6N4XXC7_9FLAO|nr:hypothetical protein [Chryseobacterium fistulae]CAA7392423.1 hypothetical protein CHRY9393_03143 [Chryseobacterium fistulae]
MAVTGDAPKIIYVRDIGEAEAEAFQKIKEQFGFYSNNKTIQALFLKFLEQQKEISNLKNDRNKLLEKNRKLESAVEKVKQFAKVLNSFEDD